MKFLLTDSRQLTSPSQSIFFAIKGLHHDGHRYIRELYQKGVREFVVERKALTPTLERELATMNANIKVVESSIGEMQKMAAEHRKQFDIPVIGITGSNGKTIVKEWLAVLLSNKFNIVRSPKSYNSQLGVPLSVWQMNEHHTLGIFEAGISKMGEMTHLEEVIQPTIGILTNIGTAHDEGFPDRKTKLLEKLQLFKRCKVLIYSQAPLPPEVELSQSPPAPRGGVELPATLILAQASEDVYPSLTLPLGVGGLGLGLGLWGSELLSICIATLQYFGYSQEEIAQRIQLLKPLSMRLELKEGINNCYLIDDTYNNDLAGLTMALNFLNLQQQKTTKTLILSDLLETGKPEAELYQDITQLLKEKKVQNLIGIGEVISRNRALLPPNAIFYQNTEDFLENHPTKNFQEEVILVKGARKFAFERIVQRLQRKTHGTVLEINLDALLHNLNYYRSKIGNTKIMVMVKALAYGSGSAEVATLLQYHGVDYLAVAYTDEGVTLRENGIYTPIMVMNPQPQDFQKLIDYSLDPEIYSPRILQEFSDFIDSQKLTAKIHLKLDTGMHRLGFEVHQLAQLIENLRRNPNLIIASIFSHLAGADAHDLDDFTHFQISTFTNMADEISEKLGYSPERHLLNSAGIARFPDAKMNIVRLGVGLYGVAARSEDQAQLQTVGTLKTVISQIKHLKVGETVGYGRKGNVAKDMTTATIAIGYADGYDRRFSRGVGKVLVNGTLCPVIGNVCMDMTMIDITGVTAQEGDEVIVFGESPTILELAQQIDTIPYEILTNVSSRVKRVFYQF